MSLSGTLGNALSGLNAASRGAQVVSSNVANALTDGYGRRILETSSRNVGGAGAGVHVDGVRRDVNAVLISDRRLSQAESGQAEVRSDALSQLEAALGTADSADSISGRIAALESALVAAASRPDSDTRLADVRGAAEDVTARISTASDDIQKVRMEADRQIALDVETLNDTLARIAEINVDIRSQVTSGNDPNALMDQRQVLVDQIAEIVPLRQMQRDNGMIALYTETGAALVDGKASVFGFQPSPIIVPEMTVQSGALSGLTLNGQPVSVSGRYAQMAGGRLAALFEQRDTIAPAAQESLDALARDLIERFAQSGVDPSLAAGEPGLFTDGGAALDLSNPATEIGLSKRISVNAQTSDLWRLRSGLGAGASAVPVGDSTLLNAYADALTGQRVPGSGPFSGRAFSASGLAAETVSSISVQAQRATEQESFAAARTAALKETELQQGVDTDAELQDLMLYEQAYAANAKVIKAVDEMIQKLLEI